MFVNIESTNFADPSMEVKKQLSFLLLPSYSFSFFSSSSFFFQAVDIRHIADKFPEKNGGLKELFEKGPQDRFFLVKFWADINTALLDDANAFYGVTSQ